MLWKSNGNKANRWEHKMKSLVIAEKPSVGRI
jgi:hypothetical protein